MDPQFFESDSSDSNPQKIIDKWLKRAEKTPNDNLSLISNDDPSHYQQPTKEQLKEQYKFSLEESDMEQDWAVTLGDPQSESLAEINPREGMEAEDISQTASESHQSTQMEEDVINQILYIDSTGPIPNFTNPFLAQFVALNQRIISVRPVIRQQKNQNGKSSCQCHSRCQRTKSCTCYKNGIPCGQDCFCKCKKQECLKKTKNSLQEEESQLDEDFPTEWVLTPFEYSEVYQLGENMVE